MWETSHFLAWPFIPTPRPWQCMSNLPATSLDTLENSKAPRSCEGLQVTLVLILWENGAHDSLHMMGYSILWNPDRCVGHHWTSRAWSLARVSLFKKKQNHLGLSKLRLEHLNVAIVSCVGNMFGTTALLSGAFACELRPTSRRAQYWNVSGRGCQCMMWAEGSIGWREWLKKLELNSYDGNMMKHVFFYGCFWHTCH